MRNIFFSDLFLIRKTDFRDRFLIRYHVVQTHGTVTLPVPNLSHWDRERSKSDLSQSHLVPPNLKTPLSQSHSVPPNLKTHLSQSHLSHPIRRPPCPSPTSPNLSHKVGLKTVKWSSECKPKSSMVIPGLFLNGSFEKRYELCPSRISLCVLTSISAFLVSSSRERAVVKTPGPSPGEGTGTLARLLGESC